LITIFHWLSSPHRPTLVPYTTLFRSDAANRLTGVSGTGTASSFSYDGDWNRVSQTVGAGTYGYLNDVATALPVVLQESGPDGNIDRKSTRLNSSHQIISYAVFCLKKK